ncbi:MAG: PQQ-dependent sugar dehydrogenase [Deltaproteobacteria bacterium]|nr:PQQ-dependent sugar dehydrogenase [Deltaproteobacteria bacterium]MBW2361789.1 PQQ-dependent sugar dehydrogenase [Deltaproteobacteria bacterium]
MRGWNVAVAGWCGLCALFIASPTIGGVLTGAILDDGLTADIEDVIQLPASAGSAPLARINVLREVPDGSGRLFVNDLRGRLYAIDAATVHTYLDLATLRPLLKTSPGLASGFVSFAFHPGFASNKHFYTVHSEPEGLTPPTLGPAVPTSIDQHAVLTEWTATDPAANSFSGTSRELMRIASPHRFHGLGEIAFDPAPQPGDPDYGWLYIGNGDHGSIVNGEPQQLQRLDTPLGALLRIVPLGGDGSAYSYGIPSSNPNVGDGDPATLDEIYAYGFRNAHRITWGVGALAGPYVTDIGQANVEELNVLAAGANYGWPEREGTFALDGASDPGTVFALPGNDASFGYGYPVAQYDHDEGRAIAGGFVFQADPASPLYGKFIFGDIVTGRILYADAAEMLAADDGDPATAAQLYELTLLVAGSPTSLLDVVRAELSQPGLDRVDLRFGMDLQGNLYVTTKQDGFIRRLIPETAPKVPVLVAPLQALLGLILIATALSVRRGRPAAPGGRARKDFGRRQDRSTLDAGRHLGL